MVSDLRSRRSLHRFLPLGIAVGALSAGALPACATVVTAYSCAGGGAGGNHDYVFNGFYVQNLNAANIHTVAIPYTTDSDGNYSLTLTARRGSYNGQIVGMVSKNVALSSSNDSVVTWDFNDAAITSGDSIYFVHSGDTANIRFALSPTGCAGDHETIGTSGTLNGFSVAVTITQNTSPPPPPACTPSSTTLCTDDHPGDRRFQVIASYATTQGGGLSGNGHAVGLSSLGVNQGGLFWFFGAGNPEILVKVLDGCATNNHFWVFFSAGTNVGFQLTVTDTTTHAMKVYTNPDHVPAVPVQDTSAFLCP